MSVHKRTSKIGPYIRLLRERRELTQDEFAEKLGVTRFYISLIETNKRGLNQKLFEKLRIIMKPNLRELEELRAICENENIRINVKLFSPVSKEMDYEMAFKEIHVISSNPIEITEINEENEFLMQLVKAIKNGSRKYVYWTVDKSLPRFQVFFDFLEKHKVSKQIINKTFEFIIAPPELSLLSFAIYSKPVKKDEVDEYNHTGRILIREKELSKSYDWPMGGEDLETVCDFISKTYDELKIREKSGYKLLSADQIRKSKVAKFF